MKFKLKNKLKKINFNYFNYVLMLMMGLAGLGLSACSQEPEHSEILPPLTASQSQLSSQNLLKQELKNQASAPNSASSVSASSVASSDIAAKILNSPQEQDILQTSREAMKTITASEIAEFRRLQASAEGLANLSDTNGGQSANLPPLPEACERYYQRVSACFSRQPDSQFLLEMNQQLKADLANEGNQNNQNNQNADEKSCTLLNNSFNAVARNLACE